jgi:hypothetical protein
MIKPSLLDQRPKITGVCFGRTSTERKNGFVAMPRGVWRVSSQLTTGWASPAPWPALSRVLLIISQVSAGADAIVASSMSTTGLIEGCRRAGETMRADCAGYILGVYDQMALSRLICPPNNPDGGSAQAVAVALRFLNEHPERWHMSPAFLLGESFKAAFPCRKHSD